MNTKKKIIFLTYIPSPYRVDFFNELNKFSNLFVVYYNKSMLNSGWKNTKKNHNYKFIYLFDKSKIKGLLKLIKIINNNKDEIFVIGGYSMLAEIISIFYLRLLGINFILSSDGGFITKGFIKTIIKKKLIKSAKYWLSSGINTSNTLQYYGAKSSNIFEFHFTSLSKKDILNELISAKEKNKLKTNANLKTDILYLTYVGQLIFRKGVDILIEAISSIKHENIEVLIIGDGELFSELKALVKSKGMEKKIHFLGKQSKINVLNYLKMSDLFVMPSRDDIWGLVLNEALSIGLPLIASNKVGSSFNLIHRGINGYIIESGNVNELSNSIDLICSSDIRSMQRESLKIAKYYSIEQMVLDHMVLFNKIDI